ncbi:MAG: hypothetical protein Q8L86_12415 [Vicinamibacterales bacterium]|nr:hypothetical protein [Vicinamibacterales bacterium]
MSDTETVMWNGRQFELTVRKVNEEPERWVAWIKVVGKDDLGGRNSSSFTGLMEGEVREKAKEWMIRWRN